MLETFHPSFFVLYLDRVDHFGHSGSWSYYTRAIELADSIVGLLWEFIESDSAYAGKTTMFVTNDHGRHTDDFTGHDCDCEGCRTVQLLAVGPDIRQDLVSETPRTICDIVPTIGELLGFTPEKASGSVMHELLIPQETDSTGMEPDTIESSTDQPVLSH
jgi:bisphosphoglycerate-independent phosphoglycerate mutase (AlkP superfamily)